MYHNFSAPGAADPASLNVEGIRAQFEYLRRHYKVVPLSQIAQQLASGHKLDVKMVALTIDDGRRNCYEFFFRLMKEYEMHATFFVVSSFIASGNWIWTDKVLWLAEQSNAPRELVQGKLDHVFRMLNRLTPEVRNVRIEAMASEAGISIPLQAPPKYAACSWDELREMADSGLMEIGSHTATHPILSSISDEESWLELTYSRRQIEENVRREVRSFCYPNGMPGDFRPSQVRQVEQAGYICAVVAQPGMVGLRSDRYQLPRIGMTRKTSVLEIGKYLDGVAYYWQKFAGRAS